MNVKQVAIASLKLASYNPKRRIEKSKIEKLARSIEGMGLIYPIAINAENEVIDGHRRIKAFESLKMTEIPALVVSGNRNAIYAEVNGQAQKMSGNDILNIYLDQPGAVLSKQRAKLQNMEGQIGRDLIVQMAKSGASIAYYSWAKEVARYCERQDNETFLRKTIRWMLRHKSSVMAINAVRMGVPARTIETAIKKNLRLTPTFKATK